MRGDLHRDGGSFRWGGCLRRYTKSKRDGERPPDTRKHTVLPVSIRLKSTEKNAHMRQHAGVFAANFSSNLLWQNCFAPKKSASCAEPRRVAAGILDVCQGGATTGLRETRLLRRMFSYARWPKAVSFPFSCKGPVSAKGVPARRRGGCGHPPLRNRHLCAVTPHASGRRPRCPRRSPPASP